MRKLITFYFLFIFLIFKYIIAIEGIFNKRNSSINKIASDYTDLLSVISDAQDHDIIQLESLININSTIIIDKPITIKGLNQKATIACHINQNQPAFILKTPGIILENFKIKGCLGSAISILPSISSIDINLDIDDSFILSSLTLKKNSNEGSGGSLVISNNSEFSVLIENCKFIKNYSMKSGGAIYSQNLNITISGSHFEDNSAENSGGAIAVLGSSNDSMHSKNLFRIEKSTFIHNIVSPSGILLLLSTTPNGLEIENSRSLDFSNPHVSGGAIMAQMASISIYQSDFESNIASAGGALFFKDIFYIHLESCHFNHNIASALSETPEIEQGGAIYINTIQESSKITIYKCSFSFNEAIYGGALHLLTHDYASINFSYLNFTLNFAQTGGAVLLRNIGSLEWEYCQFKYNLALYGGAVFLTNKASSIFYSSLNEGLKSLFYGNVAVDGGAIYGLGSGDIQLDDVEMKSNLALRSGGAVNIVNSAFETEIQDGEFLGNIALYGGAVNLDSAAMFVIRHNSFRLNYTIFKNNVAASGGGAIYVNARNIDRNQFTIWHALFIQNKADINQKLSYILTDLLSDNPFKNQFLNLINNVELKDAGVRGKGGAIWLNLENISDRSYAAYHFIKCKFSGNHANIGGGLYIALVESGDWRASCADQLENKGSPLNENRCKSFSFTSTKFISNSADSAGGSLFLTKPNQIYVYCPIIDYYNIIPEENYKSMSNQDNITNGEDPRPCDHWTGNILNNNSFGPILASPATELVVKEIEGNLKGHTSGTVLPIIKLMIKDIFGQVIKGGDIKDSELLIYARSSIIKGQTEATAKNGIVTFDSVTATGIPNTYQIEFYNENLKSRIYLDFSIRECHSGEQIICPAINNRCKYGEHVRCQKCNRDYYSLDPKLACMPCPVNGNCPGGPVAIPKDGYWHSTPYSPYIHECLSKDACTYVNRQDVLKNAINTNLNLSNYNLKDYKLCNIGYKGILCGSCEKGYSRYGNALCRKCDMNKGRIISVILGVLLWSLLLAVLMIRGAIAIADAGNTEHSIKLNDNCDFISDMYLKQLTSIEYSKDSVKNALLFKHSPLTLASNNISESYKIIINFLQVTSVAVSIKVEWKSFLKKLLVIQENIGGFSNSVNIISLRCLLQSSIVSKDATMVSLTFKTVMPFGILIIMIIYFSFFWLYKNYITKKSTCSNYLRSRIIISILCILFLTYSVLTQDFMRMLNCIKLDNPNSNDRYYNHGIATLTYWSEDTEITCFTNKHGFLTYIIGIPGLIFISIGAPVTLALFLNKNKNRLIEDNEFGKTYGFICMAYKERHIYWETLIMMRKGLIGAIVVFAYRLGGNLQGILALGVVILALVLHMIVQPYVHTVFNRLEAVSLVVSALTFYLGIVFNDPNTSFEAEVFCSIILFIIILTFSFYAIFEVYNCLNTYLTAYLKELKVDVCENWDIFQKIKQIVIIHLVGYDIESQINKLRGQIKLNMLQMKQLFSFINSNNIKENT